jgi:DNA-binding transcriptional regulator YiaG
MKAATTYRVTKIGKGGKRTTSRMSEKQLQVFRAQRLKDVRKNELGMTQKELADAVGVNLRTLQDWERGRTAMPKPVEILLALMKNMPSVKKKLVNESRYNLLVA